MDELTAIAFALSDPARVRALASLSGSELCLCQLIGFLKLAPSTVSRHMDVMFRAGLVKRRKEGRWHYFRLAGTNASPTVRAAIRWALRALDGDTRVRADRREIDRMGEKSLEEACACYRPE